MPGDIDLAAIRARAEAATPGAWVSHDFGYAGEQEPSSIVVHTGKFDHADLCEYESETAIAWMPRWEAQESDNAEFIAHAREDVPTLLDEVERLREKVAQPDWWYQDMADLLAERDRAEAIVARVRELVDDGMQHVYVEQDDEYGVLCSDIRAAIEGTGS